MNFFDFLKEMADKDASATAVLGIAVIGMFVLLIAFYLSWLSHDTAITGSIIEALKAILLLSVGYFTGKTTSKK